MPATAEHPLVLRIRTTSNKLEQFVIRREKTIVWSGIATFVIVFTALAAWKVWAGAYNALDLAIYRQVAANSTRGDFFGLTINPHSYLGDHVELFFAVLWPFYALVKHPLTLLFLQNVALALAAIPIAKISAKMLPKPWPLAFALIYLANPMVQNMALFEFHMLPFAIPIICFAILAYLENRFKRFILFSLLAMTVREDVALIIIGFGLLALVDRRHWRWSVVPIVLGGAWFFGALKLTGLFSGYGHYKFLAYYNWLGNSPGEILQNTLTKPWLVVQHLLQPQRIILALVLLFPFAGAPLFRARWLIPAIPIIAQIFLANATGEVVTATHYPSLLLPFLSVTLVAFVAALNHPPDNGWLARLAKERVATTFIFFGIIIYSSFMLGPLVKSIRVIAATGQRVEQIRLQHAVINSLPPGGTVVGPEDMTGVSDRPRLYYSHYIFLGQKQFSDEAYVLPDDASVVLLNQQDMLTYQSLGGDPTSATGYGRIRSMLTDRGFTLTAMLDRYSVFERRPKGLSDFSALYSVTTAPVSLRGGGTSHGPLVFNGWSAPEKILATTTQELRNQKFLVLPMGLVFTKTETSDQVYQLEFTFSQDERMKYRLLTTLGGGIFPTSDWAIGAPVTSHYRLLIPRNLRGSADLQVRVMDLEGDIGLTGVRSAVPVYSKYESVGPPIRLGSVKL